MAQPELNPFVKATACQNCPAGTTTAAINDDTSCLQPFAPVNSAALNAAVQSCLGETADGSCPSFAASNDATGNPYGVMGDWDVSRVTSLEETFYGASVFNADISKWDTVAVRDMQTTFFGASAFNADISKWDTAKVDYMVGTFWEASAFNADLSKWDTGKVYDMRTIFFNSGFKGTLCDGAWLSLTGSSNAFDQLGSSTAEYGCCDAGTYMSTTNVYDFDKIYDCAPCPQTTVANDDTSC